MPKQIKLIFLTLLIIVIITQPVYAEETQPIIQFTDLNESQWAFNSIEKLVNAGVIVGYPDGTFKPEGNITRAELVKIVNMVFEYTQKQDIANFSDVTAEHWFYDNVLIAQEAGYIVGYPDGTFRPDGLITREEFCKILDVINNFVELPIDNAPVDEISPWAVEYVNRVVSNRIMLLDQNNNFRAVDKATRAEICDALAKFILKDVTEDDTPTFGGSTGSGDNNELPDDDLSEEELYQTMDTVIRRLTLGVVPELSTDNQKEVVDDIISNMQKYQADNNHDYETAAEEVYKKYKLMTEEEQEELQNQIRLKNTTGDLLDLKEFFFPNVEI